MRQKYDASTKWLIETFAAEILRLAGVGPVAAARPLPGELVQSRQLPDGLVEVTFPDRAGTVLYLIEVNTFPYSRVPGELPKITVMITKTGDDRFRCTTQMPRRNSPLRRHTFLRPARLVHFAFGGPRWTMAKTS